MQQIIRDVINGNSLYVLGSVSTEKQVNLLNYKFQDRYNIDIDRQKAYRLRKKGECTSKLLVFFDKRNKQYTWILLVSKIGTGNVKSLEQLKDAMLPKQRIIIDNYELGRFPVKAKKISWTWRYEPTYIESLEKEIKDIIIHKNEQKLKQIVYNLKRTMPFAYSRRQAFATHKYIVKTWERYRKNPRPQYLDKFFVGYTRLI